MKPISLMTSLLSLAIAMPNAIAFTKPAPDFRLNGSDGKVYSLKTLMNGKPTLIVFFAAGCPHNEHGVLDMNRLLSQMKGKVRVVGFVNQSPQQARTLARRYHSQFVILADPSGKTMNRFGATASLDNALVLSDGELVKRWNGYNQATLKQFESLIGHAGGPVLKLKLNQFPADRQSGCAIGMDM